MKDKQNKEEQLGCNTTVYEIHVKSGLHVAQLQCFEQMGLHVHTLYSLVSLFQPPPPPLSSSSQGGCYSLLWPTQYLSVDILLERVCFGAG